MRAIRAGELADRAFARMLADVPPGDRAWLHELIYGTLRLQGRIDFILDGFVKRGVARQIVGLEVDWTSVEKLYESVGLPPTAPAGTSRVAVPVYKGRTQIGRATSTTWSTVLKKLIALATIDTPHHADGTELEFEVTVEGTRHQVPATVVKTPFFNPARKTATPRV